MSELKDCPPLKYYDFKPVEHVKVCPRYTAVLGRSEDDGIGIEELDTLQLELETLLSSANRRLRALEEQRQVGGRVSGAATPPSLSLGDGFCLALNHSYILRWLHRLRFTTSI